MCPSGGTSSDEAEIRFLIIGSRIFLVDFTFTLNLGSGLRYNLSPRYAFTAGLNWMHISNANLSQGTPPNCGIRNYGINVVGPMIALYVRIGRHPRRSE
ncbi:MAG: acyloxyacyl hydrolase [Candidatus Sulfotelmatobacter sp.]